MSKQREALVNALATLEDIFGRNKIDVGVINQVREALAEPEQEPAKRLQWHLDSEASKFLADLILACEEPTEITLSVGLIQEDNGAIKHGLLVHETEMPEEGKSLLVECEPIGISPQSREWKELSEDDALLIFMRSTYHGGVKGYSILDNESKEKVLRQYREISAALRAKNGL